MTKLEELIKELCPNGVEYKTISQLCNCLPKGTLKVSDLIADGTIPVINAGRDLYGFYNKYNNDCEAFTLSSRGEYAGFVNYFNAKFWAGGLCYPYSSKDEKIILTKFIYYFLKTQESFIMNTLVAAGGIPALNKGDVEKLQIPLPPLAVQRKIVQILDKFTLLSAELTAELTARRKQYEFYRDKLLDFNFTMIKVMWKSLGELGDFYGGLNGKTKSDFTNGNAKLITYKNVYLNSALRLDVEDTVIIEPNEKQNTLQYGDIIFTGSSETPEECGFSSVVTKETNEKLYLNSFCFFLRLHDSKILLPEFSKYLFRSNNLRIQICKTASGVTRYNVSKDKMKKVVIPVPPIDVQERIVKVLDNFDAICSDLEMGLPAEIEARQKQYEFYRDKLLKF